MRQKRFYTYALILLFTVIGCKKDKTGNTEITVASVSGTYGLTSLTWTYGGSTYNIYDSLDACEKDNLIKLNADLSANFMDAGTICSPAEDDNGTWFISSDSLYLQGEGTKIKSFDGKTLVLTGSPDPDVTAETTLTKK